MDYGSSHIEACETWLPGISNELLVIAIVMISKFLIFMIVLCVVLNLITITLRRKYYKQLLNTIHELDKKPITYIKATNPNAHLNGSHDYDAFPVSYRVVIALDAFTNNYIWSSGFMNSTRAKALEHKIQREIDEAFKETKT